MPHAVETDPENVRGQMTVRRAGIADLDALVDLEQRSFAGDRMSRRQYRRHLASETARVLVACDRSRLLGSAVLFFRQRSTAGRLYSLATDPLARGRGVGRALLDAVVDAGRQRGCQVLGLEVRSDNHAAIALYERAGWLRVGRYASYYEDGADAWRYRLRLFAA